jgi:hypothetical protein
MDAKLDILLSREQCVETAGEHLIPDSPFETTEAVAEFDSKLSLDDHLKKAVVSI